MENLIADRLNTFMEDMMNILRKVKKNCPLEFQIILKISHIAKFSFENNKFEHSFSFSPKIKKTHEIQNLNFFEENFQHLANLNTTLSQYTYKFEYSSDNLFIPYYKEINENSKNDFHSIKFEYIYKNYEHFFTEHDTVSPILVDDFINKEIDKLNFIYSLENSDNLWKAPTLEPEKFTFLYFSSYEDKSNDLKILEDLNDLAEKIKSKEYNSIRPIFILPSGVSENRKISYEGLDLLDNCVDLFTPNLLEDFFTEKNEYNFYVPNNLQEIENYEISSYEKEHFHRDFESTNDFEFALNFFNTLREKLSEEFEYYFLDRRHFLNEKLNFFQENKAYLINSKGVILDIINLNKESGLRKLQEFKSYSDDDQFLQNFSSLQEKDKVFLDNTIPCIEKLIKILCQFKLSIKRDFTKKIYVDSSYKIIYNFKFNFEISKDCVNLVKFSNPELDYNITEEFSQKLKLLIKNLEKCNLGLNDLGSIYADKSQKLDKCISYLDSILKKHEIYIDISNCVILNKITQKSIVQKECIFRIKLDHLPSNYGLEMLKFLYKISKGDQLKFLFDSTFSEWNLLPKIEIGDEFIPLENMSLLEIVDNGKININNNVILKPESSQISNNKSVGVIIFWNPFNISNYHSLNEIVDILITYSNEQFFNFQISAVAMGVDLSDKSTVCKAIFNNKKLIKNFKKIKFFIIESENSLYEEIYNIKNYEINKPCIMIISEEGRIKSMTSNIDKLEEILYSLSN